MADNVRASRIKVDDIRIHPMYFQGATTTDLGDLRDLSASIERHGVKQPIDVEQHPDHYALRFGRRRFTACQLLGLKTIPAIIHTEHVDEQQFLEEVVQENLIRVVMDDGEKVRIAKRLLAIGCTPAGIAETFATEQAEVKRWLSGRPVTPPQEKTTSKVRRPSAASRATARLKEMKPDLWESLLAEEREADRLEAENGGSVRLRVA